MKKIFTFLMALGGALLLDAADYPYLVFTNTSGTNVVLSVENLTFNVSGSTLQVSNAEGTTTFTLTDLASMQFSMDGSTDGLEDVLNADLPVSVYSLTGVSLGTFDNLQQAVEGLDVGSYVISDGKNAQTIVVQ
ncbi:MAG: hypothetical protein IJ621_05885 [Paludibacteraceae bacterium]|nr:hypothetical protein [Paludibacteraceae bacterium]